MSEEQSNPFAKHVKDFEKELAVIANMGVSRDGLILVLNDLNEALRQCETLDAETWNALDAAATDVIRALGHLANARQAFDARVSPDIPERGSKTGLHCADVESDGRDPATGDLEGPER